MTDQPRRAIAYLVLLVALAFAGDRLGALLLDRIVMASHLRFSAVYRGGLRTDILVLGDSRGVAAIYPPTAIPALGRQVFNLSYNGLSTTVQEALLADYLDHNPPPALVVMEATSLAEPPDALADLKPYVAHSPRLNALFAAAYPTSATAGMITHLFRYDSDLFLRVVYCLRCDDQAWINRERAPATLLSEDALGPTWRLEPRPDNLAALGRIARLLQARGVPLRLFLAPYPPARERRLVDRDAFQRAVAGAVGGEARLWDFTAALTDPAQFADPLHINDVGSRALLDSIVRSHLLDLTPQSDPHP